MSVTDDLWGSWRTNQMIVICNSKNRGWGKNWKWNWAFVSSSVNTDGDKFAAGSLRLFIIMWQFIILWQCYFNTHNIYLLSLIDMPVFKSPFKTFLAVIIFMKNYNCLQVFPPTDYFLYYHISFFICWPASVFMERHESPWSPWHQHQLIYWS